jgi:cell division inhibitor SepF
MAKAFKKMANYLGLVDDEDFTSEVQEEVVEAPRRGFRALSSGTSSESLPSYMRPANPTSAGVTPVASLISRPTAVAPVTTSMDRIITIHPRIYSDVRSIGEAYRNGQPVIMNLSEVDESECKRLVDFASGLVFGHYGKIKRITSKVFLLTPANVAVDHDDKSGDQSTFFNQS